MDVDIIDASSLPSKYQVTYDLVVSKILVVVKERRENLLVACTSSHFSQTFAAFLE